MRQARAMADRGRDHLRSDAVTREVQDEISAARRLGVTAVPTYAFDDRYVVEGAQPTELFVQPLDLAAREGTPSTAP